MLSSGRLLLVFGMSLSAAGVTMTTTNLAAARGVAPAAGGLAALYLPATILVSMACNGMLLRPALLDDVQLELVQALRVEQRVDLSDPAVHHGEGHH